MPHWWTHQSPFLKVWYHLKSFLKIKIFNRTFITIIFLSLAHNCDTWDSVKYVSKHTQFYLRLIGIKETDSCFLTKGRKGDGLFSCNCMSIQSITWIQQVAKGTYFIFLVLLPQCAVLWSSHSITSWPQLYCICRARQISIKQKIKFFVLRNHELL